eukprot:CAMPEP_0119042022 /NCGR_PEP_ID=MMETSP1177-20130426/14299_1 /TAXON_ID=2985 /ORGANISM="Ochromonas sp, Strain CCMP1899" /LENGTH=176 /DNA_ID=CAMNT_0007008525 /DNA_START=151 /DNA_END=681 /DNA_ORIENTATION=+
MSQQALMKILHSESPESHLPKAQFLMNILKVSNVSTETSQSKISCSSSSSVSVNDGRTEDSLMALKKLLVIPEPVALSSTPKKKSDPHATSSQSLKNKKTPITKGVQKDSSNVDQKEKKTKVQKERIKSRSNSEEDFYAGSAVLNSPNPNAVPMPDFEELVSDFFSPSSKLAQQKN